VRFAANETAVLLFAGALVSSCTYFQNRTLHEVAGVVINPDNNHPLPNVTVVLKENRRYLFFFPFASLVPFAMSEDRPVAHTISDSDGRFWFKACVTDPYYVDWEKGSFYRGSEGYRESDYGDTQAPHVLMKLFARPSTEDDRQWTKFYLKEEDSGLVDSCT
jgi:hypothetical protein